MSTIRKRLETALGAHLSLPGESIATLLAAPKRPEHGDIALPCFALAKTQRRNPAELAQEIAAQLVKPRGVAAAEAVGAFLNFRYDRAVYAEEVIGRVLDAGERFGRSDAGRERTIVVDFSSPNIAKPFHVGHLRSTLIGSSLCRIFRALGHPVVGINHLGDWGTQFGLVKIGCDLWGRPAADDPDPVQALVSVYQKASQAAQEDPSIETRARAWFKSLEDGDPAAQRFWQYARDVSLAEFEKIYARLGVAFDSFAGESFYNDKMSSVLSRVRSAGIGVVSEGSFGVPLEDNGFAMLQKADGATLYLTRDLAAIQYRYDEYRFDQALYVVGAPQSLHFKQMVGVLEALEAPYADRIRHVPFGHVEGMSTRSGGAIPLAEFLDEGHRRALAAFRQEVRVRSDETEAIDEEQVAERVSLSAIVFNDLARGRIKDVKFDWDQALSFRGDTGPYLQYAHARINGIEAKAGVPLPEQIDGTQLVHDTAHRLVSEIDRFPAIVARAGAEYEPSVIAQYLLDLAHAFSSANDVLRVKDEAESVARNRLALFVACRHVLGAGLRLLGIEPVARM